MKALAAGVPNTGLEYLSTALTLFAGEGGVDLIQLGEDRLRGEVHTSMKSDSIVCVVLDQAAKEKCKDIEDGLYESDKFIKYVDDASFVADLNRVFEIDMQLPEEVSMEVNQDVVDSSAYKSSIDEYKAQISDRDGEIKTLKFRIQELEEYLSLGDVSVSDEEYEKVKSQVIELNSKVSDLETEISELNAQIKVLEGNLELANNQVKQQDVKFSSLQADYERINRELTDEKVSSSKKSAVIKDKDKDIVRLKAELSQAEEVKRELAGYEAEKVGYNNTIADLTKAVSDLRIEISGKDSEINRLTEQIRSSATDTRLVLEYKKYLKDAESEKAELEKKLADSEAEREQLHQDLESAISQAQSINNDANHLDSLLQDKEDMIAELNTIKIELEGKIRLLEQSSNRNTDIESTLKEVDDLRKKLSDMQSNVFARIGDLAFPKSSVRVNLIPLTGIKYNNIRFVFAGSTEARKGVYKCLLKEFSTMSQTKFLIVDAVVETYIDYVFQINKITPGINWFTKGGGTQPYLSSTCLSNVRALSLGLNYTNDSFLFTVDWARRLSELNNSGYSVVVVCGDISSLVGRVMFESFSELGAVTVYAAGNSVGSRTVLSNMRGLTTARNATVVYYDFNKKMTPFYDKMSQICNCHILNSIS